MQVVYEITHDKYLAGDLIEATVDDPARRGELLLPVQGVLEIIKAAFNAAGAKGHAASEYSGSADSGSTPRHQEAINRDKQHGSEKRSSNKHGGDL